MKRYGLLFGNPKRRKTHEMHEQKFMRNSAAKAYTDMGFRVRTFELKGAGSKAGKKGWI